MSSFRIRPRFKENLSLTKDAFKDQIDQSLKDAKGLVGLISESYCVLKIPTEERHYWSPQLTITIEEDEHNDHITVRGLYGPKPSVWAVFFMSYAALGVLALFAGVYGLSLLMLEKPAPILWAVPAFAVIALILYFIAQGGQKIGAEQMFRIHHFYEAAMKHHVKIG
jgi:hypothetical protein